MRRTATRSKVVLFLTLVGLVGVCASGSGAGTSGVEGRIAIVSELHGSEVYIADANGANARRLTNDVVGSRWPALSPDGRRLAFARKHASGWSIYVQDVGGTSTLDVTAAAGYGGYGGLSGYPDWSPDGSKLAFTQEFPDGRAEVIVYDLGRHTAQNVTNDDSVDLRPRWSPDGAKLVYSSNGTGGNLDIYTVNADGTGIVRLTSQPGWELDPTWSPDGRQLAYTSYPAGIADIFVMNADGTGVHDVTNDPRANDYQPTWSNAGIAFSSTRSGQQVCVIAPDGSQRRTLTSGTAQSLDPHWSATGSSILYSSTRDARSEIGLVVGSSYRALTKGPWLDTDPAWSHDGKRLAYARSSSPGHSDIFVADANGGHQRNLTRRRGINWGPEFSPDSKTLAFVRFEGFGAQIWSMGIDGTHAHALTSAGPWNEHPSWSPDGRRLVYVGQRNGAVDLFVLDLRTHRERRLTSTPVSEADPAWSPDGKWIAFAAPTPPDNAFAAISRIKPDGSRRTQVTRSTIANDTSPSWSPDSTQILYDEEHFLGHDFDIYSTDLAGDSKQPVAEFPWSEHHAAWQPGH